MPSHLAQSIASLCLSSLVLGCVLVNGWTSSHSTTQSPTSTAQDVRLPAEPQTLHPGGKHTYPLALNANDCLKLVVEQQGIDVVVRLLGPDQKKLAEMDSPNGTQGPEPLSCIVEQSGSYTLEVESLDKTAPPGKYELKLESAKPATEQDRTEVEIKKLIVKAEQLRQAGKYDQALPLAQQALEKSEKLFGPEHLLVAESLNLLAVVCFFKGDYAQAEPLWKRSLAMYEKMLAPNHGFVATTRNNLAELYRVIGDYARAEPLYQRALAVREKALGPDDPETAQSLNNLANLYRDKGNYTKAEPLFKRALAIYEKARGPNHPNVAISSHNLAGLYYYKGDYLQAEPLYQRALAIYEKALGPNHPNVATTLNSLALLYRAKGDSTQIEPLLKRALAIYEKALGPDHPNVALSLNTLGSFYRDKGNYVQSELLYQRALAIYEKALGPNHLDVAATLSLLALLYQAKGDYTQVEPLLKRVLAIREKALGPDHPNVAVSLNYLAVLYQARGETAQAIQYWTRGNDATERDLMRNLASGSEQQKALYLKTTAGQMDQSISFNVKEAPQNVTALQAALTVILRRKGRALDAMTGAIETLRRQQTPETQKVLDDYAGLAGQISVLTLRGPGKKKPEEHLAYLKNLEQQKEKLEAEICAKSAEFKAQVTPITLENVQHEIPPQASLVEYAVYRPYDAKTQKFGNPRYVAYVLKNPKPEVQGSGFRVQGIKSASIQNSESQSLSPGVNTLNPEARTLAFVDLGEAEAIDQAVMALRQVLKNPSKKLKTEVQPRSQALYKLVVQPIEPLVGTTNHLLISPDGALNLIPFSALTNERGQFLVEKYTLTYLTSGRDLLRLKVKLPSEEPPLVLADPDYASGTGPVVAGQSLKPLLPLPATVKEGQEIQKLMEDARLIVKTEATENTIKAVHRPALLHVATHGYFLTDTPRETPIDPVRSLSDTPVIKVEELRIENPLLRSWLFFAGANRGGNEENDGIMTALEAAQLDLWGTKLVTLSACETGFGEAKTGDGVYGLRRALVLAGSEAQMMSLWSVSDQATRKLMVDYYTRLKAGEGRSQALRNVQLEMLKDPRRQHPFYWASFIQSGEWANLEGKR